MKTIYKYQLIIDDIQVVKMPYGSVILTVALQENIPCIWALVDTDNPQVDRIIKMVGTGHQVDWNAVYIGTFLTLQDRIVFHVFEVSN